MAAQACDVSTWEAGTKSHMLKSSLGHTVRPYLRTAKNGGERKTWLHEKSSSEFDKLNNGYKKNLFFSSFLLKEER